MTPVGGAGGASVEQIVALRQQIIERNRALQDLRQGGQAEGATQAQGPAGGGFAGTLQNALADVSATQGRASDLSAAYERGEVTDIAQVMIARQEAGIAFEATMQVRNKLLSAYQDIMRMGI